jgi:predicted O-methyltransferase YrrM
MKKIDKFLWFLLRPNYFFVLTEILKNKFFSYKNQNSLDKCKKKNITYSNLKKKIFYKKSKKYNLKKFINFKNLFEIVKKNKIMLTKAQNYNNRNLKLNLNNFVKTSGASNIELIYEIIRDRKPKNILETGVAYGWSSYVILLAVLHNKFGKLISVDLPYPLINERKNIGILVPKKIKKNWSLILDRDTNGIKIALKKFNYKIDLFHYDSDKNYDAKLKNLLLVWKNINHNGVVICDDINDNHAFFDFTKLIKKKFYVIKTDNKYVGILVND